MTRRDAARNRERLLIAARSAFAEYGPDVPLEEVARAADVSRTTLYRHFPTREELAATIFEDNVAQIEQRAGELRAQPDGVVALLDFVLDMQIDNRSITRALAFTDIDRFTRLANRTAAAFEPLLASGRQAGIVAPDVELADLMLAFPMIGALQVENDPTIRQNSNARARKILHRALFIEAKRHPSRSSPAAVPHK